MSSSTSSFADLKIDSRIIKILKESGISTPTDIQSKTYPLAANGHDVIGVSQTGSGKTLAFVLPTVSQVLLSDKPFHTLIIAPTRELVMQTSSTLLLFESLGVRVATLVGGEIFSSQVNQINLHPHVIVGTPGRIVKHIEKTKNFKIGSIRKLILDEADRFFEQDFTSDLEKISEHLERKNQALMFTATLTDKTETLSKLFMRSPRVIGNTTRFEAVSSLKDYYAMVPDKYKNTVLVNYVRNNLQGSKIIFVAMCSTAQKISTLLLEFGISCACLHGGMAQIKREEIMQSFRREEFSILVSTDLASRGLDFPHVDDVVNFDLPTTAKDYMHRVGRTARAGKSGTAISFCTQYDIARLQKLEYVLKKRLEEKTLELYEDYDVITEAYDNISAEYNESKKRK